MELQSYTKKEIERFLQIHKSNSEFVYWLSVSKVIFDNESYILFGAVYIPPYCSKYSSIEVFSEIENELMCFPQKCYVFSCG